MLTLEEVLSDVADLPSFSDIKIIDVNSHGNHGETPLHWMATLGDIAGIKLLIEAGADINSLNDEGNTPLHEAVVYRQAHASRFLIESGSSLILKNKAGMSPVEIAEFDNYAPTMELFNS